MASKWIFWLLVIWIIAEATLLYIQPQWLADAAGWRRVAITAGAVIVPGGLLYILYMSVVRPISAVNSGMDLVRAQDFNSRLVKVGQRDADRLVGMFNRIIDRLKEERLHSIEQEHFLQLLIKTSPVGIMILDFDGRISLVNPAMTRYLDAKESSDITGLELNNLKSEVASAISATPQRTSRTLRISDTNIMRISRLDFMEKGFSRPYVLVESLTDEVMRAEKEAYGKVIRLIAHEVNNTMAGVKSILETLSSILEEQDLVEAIDSCNDRCGSMSEFITAYADVVKIPQAKLQTMDIANRIASLMPFLEGLAGSSATVRLTVSTSAPPLAMIDPVLFEQTIVNIVKNSKESIESTGRHGNITITVTDSPIAVTVTDNGAGITPEASGHIFSPFFSTKRGGQGLGLMMVGDILRKHGCRFSLRTDNRSGLTSFKIDFPNANQALTASAGQAIPSSDASAFSSDALG